MRWEGWRDYNSEDLYKRLCLSYESNPSPDQIEENCRQLLIWWQKKLPLKNQPSNPLSQMLRSGMDEAPAYLAEARTKLLDAEARSKFDQQLHSQIVLEALGEFKKLLLFALGENRLREEDENRLYERGRGLGLSMGDMKAAVEEELARVGAERVAAVTYAPPVPAPVSAAAVAAPHSAGVESRDAFSEFRRMLRLSKLALDGEEMTDDQRDAMCNMGESLGLTGGQAEDLIDEYLEEMAGMPPTPMAPAARGVATAAPRAAVVRPAPVVAPVAPKPVVVAPVKKVEPAVVAVREPISSSPLAKAQERQNFPNYTSALGVEMLLVSSGSFLMGSAAPDAAPHEQPVAQVNLNCFYLSRYPIRDRRWN